MWNVRMLLTYDLKCQPQDKCLPSLSTLYSHSGLKETHYHSWQQILDKYPDWKGCYSKGWIKHVRVNLPNSARGFHPKSFCPSGDSNISNSSQPDDPKNCKHRFLRSPTWWLMVLCNYFAFWVAVPFNLLNLLLNQLNYKGTSHCFFFNCSQGSKNKKSWTTMSHHFFNILTQPPSWLLFLLLTIFRRLRNLRNLCNLHCLDVWLDALQVGGRERHDLCQVGSELDDSGESFRKWDLYQFAWLNSKYIYIDVSMGWMYDYIAFLPLFYFSWSYMVCPTATLRYQ